MFLYEFFSVLMMNLHFQSDNWQKVTLLSKTHIHTLCCCCCCCCFRKCTSIWKFDVLILLSVCIMKFNSLSVASRCLRWPFGQSGMSWQTVGFVGCGYVSSGHPHLLSLTPPQGDIYNVKEHDTKWETICKISLPSCNQIYVVQTILYVRVAALFGVQNL